MKFHELIKTNDWASVELILVSLYPNQEKSIEGYREVFHKLRAMRPMESDIQIVLEQVPEDDFNEESYVHVSGLSPQPENSLEEVTEAIEFVPWAEWLGMSIQERSRKEFNELEIISHCLFEMTFAGFDEEQIQQQISELQQSIAEFDNMTEEEKRANTRSLDELFNDLEEDDEPEA